MAQFELILPKMGESVAEATITNWLKNEGDTIDAEESVVEVATDKVDSEVPSPVSGTIVKILAQVNDVAAVGGSAAHHRVWVFHQPQAMPLSPKTRTEDSILL